MNDTFSNLGKALGLLREMKGLSSADLARRARLGKGQLSRYEQGKDLPTLDPLARILRTLQISQSELFLTVALIDQLQAGLQKEYGVPAEEVGRMLSRNGPPEVREAVSHIAAGTIGMHQYVMEMTLKMLPLLRRSIQTQKQTQKQAQKQTPKDG